MSETLSSSTCPGCGAPLELLPDGTCRWCHARVAPTGNSYEAKAAAFFRLSDSWNQHWSLGAPPGNQHAIPWEMGADLLTPAKEILAVVHAGIGQPGLVALAQTHGKDPDLDWQVTLLLNTIISAGIDADNDDAPAVYLETCDLLDALASVRDTDPQWAQNARDVAAKARADFGIPWAAAVEGDPPDPFQAELRAWIGKHRKDADHHHFWQR